MEPALPNGMDLDEANPILVYGNETVHERLVRDDSMDEIVWRALFVKGGEDRRGGQREIWNSNKEIQVSLEVLYKLIEDNCFVEELLCKLNDKDKLPTHPEMLTVNGRKGGKLCAEKCKDLISGTRLRDTTSEYMQEVIGILNKPNSDRFANWKFKYFVANCAFENAGIESVNKDNELVRKKLTTREMDWIIFLVTKSHHPDEWHHLSSLMPYFEWELVHSIMSALDVWLESRKDEMNEHLEVIDGYLEECVRKTFGGMMAEYGV